MGENIRFNFPQISVEYKTQALDSVTGGLVNSVDAKGIGAVQTGIDAFSGPGFDQAVVTGDKPIATEPGAFSSPQEYLKQIPESGSPQVLEQLENPHFNFTQALTNTFNNVFGDGGINDVANQLGMGMTPDSTQAPTNDPGEAAGGPNAPDGGTQMPNDDGGGAAAGPSSTDAYQSKIYNEDLTGAQTGTPSTPGSQFSDGVGDGGVHPTDTGEGGPKMPNPLEGSIQMSDLAGAQTGASSAPGSQFADVGDGGIHPTDTGEGGPKMPNPLESAIQLSDLAGAQTGAPSTPGSQFSDGVGDGGVHPTDTGEGGPKMPNPEDVAGRIDITDTGETAGEIQWGDSPDSMAIMGQRGSGEEQIDIPPPGTGQQPLQSQFFQDLLSNNFSRFQNFGDTLHQLLTMQQDVLNRQ